VSSPFHSPPPTPLRQRRSSLSRSSSIASMISATSETATDDGSSDPAEMFTDDGSSDEDESLEEIRAIVQGMFCALPCQSGCG
jgi:hypothetical protein